MVSFLQKKIFQFFSPSISQKKAKKLRKKMDLAVTSAFMR